MVDFGLVVASIASASPVTDFSSGLNNQQSKFDCYAKSRKKRSAFEVFSCVRNSTSGTNTVMSANAPSTKPSQPPIPDFDTPDHAKRRAIAFLLDSQIPYDEVPLINSTALFPLKSVFQL
jgi:hypothetical protein